MATLQQRTPAWFEARKNKLTASNLGGTLGLMSWVTRKTAFKRATGTDTFEGNDATRHGNANELNAVMQYSAVTGNKVDATGVWTHPDYPWIMGSPDGLVGEDGLIEVKCPFYFKRNGAPRVHSTIPVHYYPQVNALLEITGRKWCDFVSWAPEGMKIVRVERDPDTFELLMAHYAQFYAAIDAGMEVPPPMTVAERTYVRNRISEAIDARVDKDLWAMAVAESALGKRSAPAPDLWDMAEEGSPNVMLKTPNGRVPAMLARDSNGEPVIIAPGVGPVPIELTSYGASILGPPVAACHEE